MFFKGRHKFEQIFPEDAQGGGGDILHELIQVLVGHQPITLGFRLHERLQRFLHGDAGEVPPCILFITLPGLALDLGLTSGAASDPVVVMAGASLLFVAIPLVLRLNRSMTAHEPSPVASRALGERVVGERADAEAAPTALAPPPYLGKLTAQELRVYELLRLAMTDKHIAEKLVISPNTVKYHTRRILRKAGAANRKELLANNLRDQNPVLPHPHVDLD